jgi:hypothetical protein
MCTREQAGLESPQYKPISYLFTILQLCLEVEQIQNQDDSLSYLFLWNWIEISELCLIYSLYSQNPANIDGIERPNSCGVLTWEKHPTSIPPVSLFSGIHFQSGEHLKICL